MKIRSRIYASVFSFTFVMAAGCQAPLQLDDVAAQSAKLTQRYDAFQTAAIQGTTALILGSDGIVLELDTLDPKNDKRISLKSANGASPSFIASATCSDGRFYALTVAADVWERHNNGQWVENKIDTIEYVQDIACAPNGTLWVSASFSTLYSSKDNGKTWVEATQNEDSSFNQLSFPGNNTGYALGEFGMVFKTEDAGESWHFLDSITPEFYPLSAYFKNSNEGWAGSLRGSIYKTSDGGNTWSRQITDSTAPIYTIKEVDGHMVALGNYGTFLSLQNGQWKTVKSGAPETYGYLRALTASTGKNPTLFIGGQGFAARIKLQNINLGKPQ